MANLVQLQKLKEGVIIWNAWRQDNRAVISVDLSIANLNGAYLSDANLDTANLSGSDLRNVDLSNAALRGAKLIGANVSAANLSGADLNGANLSYAELGNVNLRESSLIDANLSSANLSSADLRAANLSGALLHRANLVGANLSNANLMNSDLRWADLNGASLNKTAFGNTNLRDANLINANLIDANLRNVDLNSASLGRTFFGNTNLSGVKGLEHCKFGGPSFLDYHTLAISGRLPLPFLRGCGLSDNLIDYLPSLLGQAIEFYSCFISYSTKDQEFADRLFADLQNKGVRCWFAPQHIQGGKKIHEQIDEAIRVYDRLLLILSDASMESKWVETEIAHARQKELAEKRQVLFPISLVQFSKIREWSSFDADTGKDSAREIREYYIPDFSNWKNHDSYQKVFARLIADLKSENPPPRTQH
jgi:uncharacterized protein YjbI with pentapeptide repeats